jgi:cell division protein YceG involved in septum cleavage
MMSGEPRPPVIVISDPKDRFSSGEKKARRGIFEWTVLFGLLIGVLSWLLLRPGIGLTKNVVVTYEEGTPLGLFLDDLKEQGIIRSVLATRVFVHVYGSQEHVPAGEYFFF